MTSDANNATRRFDSIQREPDSRSSLSAFLTSVSTSPTKEYDSRCGNAPRAKRPRSSCRRASTNEQNRRGRKRRRTVHAILSRTGALGSKQEEEEEELAHISGSSSSGESDGCTIAVEKTVLDQHSTKHKQDAFDASRTSTVASFLRAGECRLGDMGLHGSITSSLAPQRSVTLKQPTGKRRRRRGVARGSDYGASELNLVDTGSDSDYDRVEPTVLGRSGDRAVQEGRKEEEAAEAPRDSVTSTSGQAVVGGGGLDMSVFVESVQQQLGAGDEEDAAVREEEEEQILTSDR